MGGDSGLEVVARHGNWYQGDDDLYSHCLILRNGQVLWLNQGLSAVTVRQAMAPAAPFKRLLGLLSGLPKHWPASSYAGYNFILDPEAPGADEIAVFGVQDGDAQKAQRYLAADPASDVARLVREIANIDEV